MHNALAKTSDRNCTALRTVLKNRTAENDLAGVREIWLALRAEAGLKASTFGDRQEAAYYRRCGAPAVRIAEEMTWREICHANDRLIVCKKNGGFEWTTSGLTGERIRVPTFDTDESAAEAFFGRVLARLGF
jgi:hypothetical protein